MSTKWPTTVFIGEVKGLNIENKKLIYKADAKSDLESVAFLEMWAHIRDSQYFLKGMNGSGKRKVSLEVDSNSLYFSNGAKHGPI